MYRNNTGFWVHYTAYNSVSNAAEPGDAANHALQLVIDGIETVPNNTPEDIAFGECRIFIDAAESNGAKLISVGGVSGTPDVHIITAHIKTDLFVSGGPFVGCYNAWDKVLNEPAPGDAVNHSILIAQDNTNSAAPGQTEINSFTLPGLYRVSGTGAQSNGKSVSIIGDSSNADVNVIPTQFGLFNVDYPAEADTRLGTVYAEATRTGTAAIPDKSDVRTLVPVDDTVGDYVPAEIGVVLEGEQFGSQGTEFTGTLVPFQASYELPQEIILEAEEIIIFEGCD